MTPNRTSSKNPPSAEPPRRRPLVGSIVLLCVTLAVGFAARGVSSTPLGGGPPLAGAGSAASPVARLGDVSLGAQLDRASVLEQSDGLVKLELILGADPGEATLAAPRAPTDLIVVLDRSGSMKGHAITHARAAIHALVSQLDGRDRFGLVTYASGAEVAIPLEQATPRAREHWRRVVDGIGVGGGTNMSGGLDLLPTMLGTNRRGGPVRVVLISDGHANEGDATPPGLRERAARAVAGEYVLSTAGVGEGFDENLMTTLADAGTGNFYYVQRGHELQSVFAGEFAAARREVASGLTVALELAPGVQVLDAGGYPLEVDARHVRFRPGSLFSGQERRIWVTLRAPTDRVGDVPLARVALEFRAGGQSWIVEAPEPLEVACVEGEEDFLAGLDEDAWSRGVIVDSYNAVKADVAQALQNNEPLLARQAVAAYEARVKKVNEKLEREEVKQQISRLRALGSMADEAFAASPADRNRLSKDLTAAAVDDRRVGSKASVAPSGEK